MSIIDKEDSYAESFAERKQLPPTKGAWKYHRY